MFAVAPEWGQLLSADSIHVDLVLSVWDVFAQRIQAAESIESNAQGGGEQHL